MSIQSPISKPPVQPWTPDREYTFHRTPAGSLAVDWTPTVKKTLSRSTVVYQIKNTRSLKRYIGQTCDLFKRISSHKSNSKHRIPTPLSRALLAHPERFVVGATATNSPDELETFLIKAKKTKRHGYNGRNGGGGGKARTPVHIAPELINNALTNFTKSYISPAKFPLSKSRKKITHTLPKELQGLKNVVYIIHRRKLNGKIARYVGCSERKVARRIQEHLWAANHHRHIRNRSSPLYKAMHRHSNEFFISIISFESLPKEFPAHIREKIVIQFYKNQGLCTLFNKNHGGGGGSKK